mgnify:CR=1 FL=1
MVLLFVQWFESTNRIGSLILETSQHGTNSVYIDFVHFIHFVFVNFFAFLSLFYILFS